MKTGNARIKAGFLTGTAILLGILAQGCSTAPPVREVDAPFNRIAIVNLADQPPYEGAGGQVASLLAEELPQFDPEVDTIVLGRDELDPESGGDYIRRGAVPLEVLTHVRERYRADALLVGRVSHFEPYWEPSVGVSLKVLDTANTSLISSVTGRWDSGTKQVRDKIKRYHERNRHRDECRFGPNIFTTSPRYFLLFVSHDIARDILHVPDTPS